MRPLGIGGLTLASTLSATVNMGLLYSRLRKRVGPIDERRILTSFFKIALASLLMGVAAFFYDHFILQTHGGASRLFQAGSLGLGIVLSALVYFLLTLLLKIEEIKKFIR